MLLRLASLLQSAHPNLNGVPQQAALYYGREFMVVEHASMLAIIVILLVRRLCGRKERGYEKRGPEKNGAPKRAPFMNLVPSLLGAAPNPPSLRAGCCRR